MKTKFGTKLVSILLCVCMLIPMFTACGNKDKDKDDDKPLSWEATEDQVIPLEMDIQNGESNTKLVLSYGEDILNSIRSYIPQNFNHHKCRQTTVLRYQGQHRISPSNGSRGAVHIP